MRRSLRLEGQNTSAKDDEKNLIKSISLALRKDATDRSAEEKELIDKNTGLVNEFCKRKRNNDLSKEREQEMEDTPSELLAKCQRLASLIHQSRSLVVYTGAGISTAASIPDYRGPNGVWTLLKQGIQCRTSDLSLAEPTYTHMALFELYRRGYIRRVVSQNCDGLHLRSGLARSVLSELHGNMYLEVCRSCKPAKEYLRSFDVTEKTGTRRHKTSRSCHTCNSPLYDTIIHFGEKSPYQSPYNWKQATQAANRADLILCLGSSLKVLKKYACLWASQRPEPPRLVVVNLQWTPKDKKALLKINGKCDEVMSMVMQSLGVGVPQYDRAMDPLLHMEIPLASKETHTTSKMSIQVAEGFVRKTPTQLRVQVLRRNDNSRTNLTSSSSSSLLSLSSFPSSTSLPSLSLPNSASSSLLSFCDQQDDDDDDEDGGDDYDGGVDDDDDLGLMGIDPVLLREELDRLSDERFERPLRRGVSGRCNSGSVANIIHHSSSGAADTAGNNSKHTTATDNVPGDSLSQRCMSVLASNCSVNSEPTVVKRKCGRPRKVRKDELCINGSRDSNATATTTTTATNTANATTTLSTTATALSTLQNREDVTRMTSEEIPSATTTTSSSLVTTTTTTLTTTTYPVTTPKTTTTTTTHDFQGSSNSTPHHVLCRANSHPQLSPLQSQCGSACSTSVFESQLEFCAGGDDKWAVSDADFYNSDATTTNNIINTTTNNNNNTINFTTTTTIINTTIPTSNTKSSMNKRVSDGVDDGSLKLDSKRFKLHHSTNTVATTTCGSDDCCGDNDGGSLNNNTNNNNNNNNNSNNSTNNINNKVVSTMDVNDSRPIHERTLKLNSELKAYNGGSGSDDDAGGDDDGCGGGDDEGGGGGGDNENKNNFFPKKEEEEKFLSSLSAADTNITENRSTAGCTTYTSATTNTTTTTTTTTTNNNSNSLRHGRRQPYRSVKIKHLLTKNGGHLLKKLKMKMKKMVEKGGDDNDVADDGGVWGNPGVGFDGNCGVFDDDASHRSSTFKLVASIQTSGGVLCASFDDVGSHRTIKSEHNNVTNNNVTNNNITNNNITNNNITNNNITNNNITNNNITNNNITNNTSNNNVNKNTSDNDMVTKDLGHSLGVINSFNQKTHARNNGTVNKTDANNAINTNNHHNNHNNNNNHNNSNNHSNSNNNSNNNNKGIIDGTSLDGHHQDESSNAGTISVQEDDPDDDVDEGGVGNDAANGHNDGESVGGKNDNVSGNSKADNGNNINNNITNNSNNNSNNNNNTVVKRKAGRPRKVDAIKLMTSKLNSNSDNRNNENKNKRHNKSDKVVDYGFLNKTNALNLDHAYVGKQAVLLNKKYLLENKNNYKNNNNDNNNENNSIEHDLCSPGWFGRGMYMKRFKKKKK